MIVIENIVISESSCITEAVGRQYFLKEGKAIFVLALQEYLGQGQIYLLVEPLKEQNDFGNYFDIFHIALKIDNYFYDVDEQQSYDKIISKFGKMRSETLLIGPLSIKELKTKYIADDDSKPLYGTESDSAKRQALALIETLPFYKQMHDKRTNLLK